MASFPANVVIPLKVVIPAKAGIHCQAKAQVYKYSAKIIVIIFTPKGEAMAIKADTIDHTTLARLVQAGAVRGTDVIGHGSGWGVVVKYGMTESALAARRGAVRTFRKFETLVSYLKEIGISQYNVNATDFDPLAIKSSRIRPDASERMRSAFEAKAHNDWLREKVADSLADPQPNIPHLQVMDEVQALIDFKRTQHAFKAAS